MSQSYNKLLERLQTGYTIDGEKFYYVVVTAQDAMGNILGKYECDRYDNADEARACVDLRVVIEALRLEGIFDGRKSK